MRKYAQMWRISNDIWDLWHSTVEYPQGLGDQFANVAKWAGEAQPGHWPDADMLPLGVSARNRAGAKYATPALLTTSSAP